MLMNATKTAELQRRVAPPRGHMHAPTEIMLTYI
jgi:hypothetical protein